MSVTLHQFPFSHFNEKVRWTLALKQIPHERISYLPGPHMGPIRRLSGQTQTPVVDWGGEIWAGSTDIMKRIEKVVPEPHLFPDGHSAEIDELVSWLDRDIGPATRTLLFSVMIQHGNYLTSIFSIGKGRLKRALYRATFPLVKGLMARANGVNPENLRRSERIARDALDTMEAQVADTGYLCGRSFTAADLTAAALFAPLANPPHPDMHRPHPVPDELRMLLDTWSAHPSIDWVNRMYQMHRPD